jgi:hypothetical protein
MKRKKTHCFSGKTKLEKQGGWMASGRERER